MEKICQVSCKVPIDIGVLYNFEMKNFHWINVQKPYSRRISIILILVLCVVSASFFLMTVKPSSSEELPFPDGRYVTDPRYCSANDDDIFNLGDAAGLYIRTLRGGTIDFHHESTCEVRNVRVVENDIIFDRVCSAEGETFTTRALLVQESPISFSDGDYTFTLCGSPHAAPADIGPTLDLSAEQIDQISAYYQENFSIAERTDLQWSLTKMHFFDGQLDGDISREELEGIESYREVFGSVDDLMLNRSELDDLINRQREFDYSQHQPEDAYTVYEAQRYLARMGFEPGPRDGLMGPQTRNAIIIFQDKYGIRVTGRPDRFTFDRLAKAYRVAVQLEEAGVSDWSHPLVSTYRDDEREIVVSDVASQERKTNGSAEIVSDIEPAVGDEGNSARTDVESPAQHQGSQSLALDLQADLKKFRSDIAESPALFFQHALKSVYPAFHAAIADEESFSEIIGSAVAFSACSKDRLRVKAFYNPALNVWFYAWTDGENQIQHAAISTGLDLEATPKGTAWFELFEGGDSILKRMRQSLAEQIEAFSTLLSYENCADFIELSKVFDSNRAALIISSRYLDKHRHVKNYLLPMRESLSSNYEVAKESLLPVYFLTDTFGFDIVSIFSLKDRADIFLVNGWDITGEEPQFRFEEAGSILPDGE